MTKKQEERRRAKLLAERPEPTEKQAAQIAAAKVRVAERRNDTSRPKVPRTKVAYVGENKVLVASPHSDDTGWSAQMADALGTADGRVVEMIQSAASRVSTAQTVRSQDDADRHEAEAEQVLAFIAENAPTNPIEASLLMQMAAVQQVSMAMVSGVLKADRRDAQADYVRLMNQTMRTFTAQAEAFHKLRTGGKQQVEVRYVYVDARTQTVVQAGGGHGEPDQIGGQPHAPGTLGHAPAPGLPMWSEDAGGHVVPIAGRSRQAALSDARGAKPGRTQGQGQRQLPHGDVDAGDGGGTANGAGTGQDVQGDAA